MPSEIWKKRQLIHAIKIQDSYLNAIVLVNQWVIYLNEVDSDTEIILEKSQSIFIKFWNVHSHISIFILFTLQLLFKIMHFIFFCMTLLLFTLLFAIYRFRRLSSVCR